MSAAWTVPFEGGGFAVIARSIVSQQLSEKAASTIWGRVAEQVGTSPELLAGARVDALRATGLSGRKVEYLQAHRPLHARRRHRLGGARGA